MHRPLLALPHDERVLDAAPWLTAQFSLDPAAGLTAPLSTRRRLYHDRPYRVLVAERFATATVTDPYLRALPRIGDVAVCPRAPPHAPALGTIPAQAPAATSPRAQTAAHCGPDPRPHCVADVAR